MTGTDRKLADQPPESGTELFAEETERYRFRLILTEDQLECWAGIEFFECCSEPGVAPETQTDEIAAAVPTPPEILWFLQQNGIVQGIDHAALYDFCALLDIGQTPEPTLLARGIPPVTGDDGWFELTVKVSGEAPEFTEDARGRKDLRTLNAYSEIEPEQKLGMVHPPRAGSPGMTVQGLPIPADHGQPYELRAGEGVTLKYDNRIAFAAKAGRALLEKQTLSVVDQLLIPGDIDLSIGNVDFHGFVEVRGEVPDDFDVRAGQGMKIQGPIGACHIESAGSVEIISMAGKEVGRIICQGDLRANYLNQVTVICYGDVLVSHEIRNCRIKATGRVSVERGAIIGGDCVALKGIEAKNLGTGSGQVTRLTAGVYFPDADRFAYLRERLKNLERQIVSLLKGLESLQNYLRKHPAAGETAYRREKILNQQLSRAKDERCRLTAESKASTPQHFPTQNAKINVHATLREGVVISLGKTSQEIKIERRGPLSIIENTRDGGLRFLSLSPIQVSAEQLEEDFLSAGDQGN